MTNLNLALTPAVTTNSLTILPWFPPSAQTWDQSSFPQGSNESYDQFGYVLVGGDFDGDGYGDLNIGSPYEDVSASAGGPAVNGGKVNTLYGGWLGLSSTGSQLWTQDDVGGTTVEDYDQFGQSLASGDFDGDGYDDLLVGSPYEDYGSIVNTGMVHAMYGSSTGLTATGNQSFFQNDINTTDESYDMFGEVVAAGDFDGDGYDDAVIGTPHEDMSGSSISNVGKVNVLFGSTSGLTTSGRQQWTQDDLSGTNEEAGDLFGDSLATGDFDGDGYDDLVIGSTGEDWGSTQDAGIVHAMYGSWNGLTASGNQYFTQSGLPSGSNEAYDRFGEVLAVGDFDGDGYDDVAVGTPQEDLNGSSITNAGKVNIIHGSSSGLTTTGSQLWRQDDLTGTSSEEYDRFGNSLAVGDFDGDGYDDLIVGSPDEDWGSTQSAGVVHAIYGSSNGLAAAGNEMWNEADFGGVIEAYDRFGASLAVSDFNRDGYDDVAIGVPGQDIGSATNSGTVHIMYGSSSGLSV